MAARRGKTQARRNQGNNGLPGWAWMVLGIVLTIAAIALAPKLLKSDGDGFFRPQPNPDARPAPVVSGGDEAAPAQSGADGEPAVNDAGPKYDFYTLLPGKEVAVSDAELAATERAEAARAAALLRGEQPAQVVVSANPDAADLALPTPVDPTPQPATTAPATPSSASQPDRDTASVAAPKPTTATAVADGVRYLLQAGAFQGASQAEELKARIAMVGLSARVEPAQINGQTIYRVRMGPYDSAGDLADAKRKLGNSGLPAMAIKVK
ncbi:SPOR domain-containing protein [Lysobacter sp. A289]